MNFKLANLSKFTSFQKLTGIFLVLNFFLLVAVTPIYALPTDGDGSVIGPNGESIGGTGSDSDSSSGGNDAIGEIDSNKLGLPTDVNDIIDGLVTLVIAVAGLLFFFMFVLGGIRYISSGGDEKAAASARSTLTQAFIGLIIVVAAFLITQLIFTIFGIDSVLLG